MTETNRATEEPDMNSVRGCRHVLALAVAGSVLLLGWASGLRAQEPEDPDSEAGRMEELRVVPVREDVQPDEDLQEDKPARLDEVVVTAQKREQVLQDVPISISVIDDDFIADQGITNVREALLFVPNIKIETGSTLGGPRCRGFGLNIRNRAFEPPCGVAVDGVAYSTPDYFELSLFDVKRIEVLRGPQGTNFGKNTTAGVVHMITKGPSDSGDELGGSLGVQLGDFGRQRIEAAFGGPLIDGFLNFRVAGLDEERDGYLRNTTAAIDPDALPRPLTGARSGIRARLGFPDLFGSNLTLGYESTEIRSFGLGAEAINVSDDMAAYMRQFDPAADFERGNFITSIDHPERMSISIDTFQADWWLELMGWRLDVVAAHSLLKRHAEADPDYFPAPAFIGRQIDDNPTLTGEVRAMRLGLPGLFGLQDLFGRDLGYGDLLVGLFYQRREIEDGLLYLELDGPIASAMLAIDGGASTSVPPPPPPVPGTHREWVRTIFNQRAETLAAFSEYEWHFLDRWTLQLGGRYSFEKKSASWDQNLSDPHPLVTAAGWAEFTNALSRDELQFLPKISLNFKPTDNISLFARWTRGVKAGGFNAFSQTGEAELTSLTFGPEKGTEWAFDAKMELLDNSARVNISVFRLNVEGFQYLVQVDDPLTGFPTGNTVVNVGEAQAQGIEADITYLPNDWLTIIATIGLNDSEFIEFPFNSCPQDEVDSDGDGDPRCDASGRPFPFTPRWNNTLTATIRTPIAGLFGLNTGDLGFTFGATIEHVSDQFLNPDYNPGSRQPSFLRYRANIGFEHPRQGWSLSLIGENLTDEVTSQREDAVLGVTGNYLEPRRTIYSQVTWEF